MRSVKSVSDQSHANRHFKVSTFLIVFSRESGESLGAASWARRRPADRGSGPGLKDPIGHRPDHDRIFALQNSVKILPEIEKIC